MVKDKMSLITFYILCVIFSEKCAQRCVEYVSMCTQKAGEPNLGNSFMVIQNGIYNIHPGFHYYMIG
jgi:hypothetical protein